MAKKTESYEIELPKARAQIRISVRDLVEFVLRSGDIDHSGGGVDTITAMLEGSRIHRKIQKKMGASYHAEVPLKFVITYEDYELGIEGRADGIIIEDDGVTIDEIKGVYLDLDNMSEPVGVHLAQAKVYGYIYATQNHLDEIGVQMTYCNLDTEDIRRFHEHYTYEELSDWFEGVLALYKRWADFSYYWKLTRQDSIHALEFPYAYREGQREVAGDVYRTIARNQILFMQAPTGSGKTLATIFPAVKAVGEGLGERIFYLTAKTITRVVAKDTFKDLKFGAAYANSFGSVNMFANVLGYYKDSFNEVAVELYAEGSADAFAWKVFPVIRIFPSKTGADIIGAKLFARIDYTIDTWGIYLYIEDEDLTNAFKGVKPLIVKPGVKGNIGGADWDVAVKFDLDKEFAISVPVEFTFAW